jgi:hypothetical protein
LLIVLKLKIGVRLETLFVVVMLDGASSIEPSIEVSSVRDETDCQL